MTDEILVTDIISQHLISAGIAGGNVVIAEGITIVTAPAVYVSESSLVGNTNEGNWRSTIVIGCVESTDTKCRALAKSIRNLLDGNGFEGIEDIRHLSTIPVRHDESNPVLFTYAISLNVTYQELLP